MHFGHGIFHGLRDMPVIVAIEVGVNAALQGDFGGSHIPGFNCTLGDVFKRE